MLNLFNRLSAPKILQSMGLVPAFTFTTMSRRDAVPKIFKDGRFTRKGVNRKKQRSNVYDLTANPYLENKHLYYNAPVDKPLENQRLKEIRKANKGLEEVQQGVIRPLENVLFEMSRKDLNSESSFRLINDIIQLETNYSGQFEVYGDAIEKSLHAIHKQINQLNLRELGIYASKCDRYFENSKDLWQDILYCTVAQIESRQYYGKNLEKDSVVAQNNITHLLNSVYRASDRLRLDATSLEKAINNYFVDKFINLTEPNLNIIFTTSICKIINRNHDSVVQILQKFIPVAEQNIDKLESGSVVALTHLLLQTKSFAPKNIISKSFIERVEKQFVSQFSKEPVTQETVGKFAVFCLSYAQIPIKQEAGGSFAQFALTYFIANKDKIQNAKDLAFIGEAFQILGIKERVYYDHAEGVIQGGLAKFAPQLIVQYLRACSKSLRFSDATTKLLIQNLEKHYLQSPESIEKLGVEMLQVTLSRFRGLVQFENMNLYSIVQ